MSCNRNKQSKKIFLLISIIGLFFLLSSALPTQAFVGATFDATYQDLINPQTQTGIGCSTSADCNNYYGLSCGTDKVCKLDKKLWAGSPAISSATADDCDYEGQASVALCGSILCNDGKCVFAKPTETGRKSILSTFAAGKSGPSESSSGEGFKILDPLVNLQVKIPGLEKIASETPATCTNNDGQTTCSLPWISIYIKAFYNYSMGIIGILAALALMIGGVIYLTAAGNATRISTATSWITGALTGMLIMFTSYILLNEINPNLISFKPIVLDIVQEETTSYETADSDLAVNTNCDGKDIKYESIQGLTNITYTAKTPSLSPAAAKKFRELATAAAKKGIQITLTSAARSIDTQKKLWEKCLNNTSDPAQGSEAKCRLIVAPPNCNATHVQGIAIDVCVTGTESCKHMGSKTAANATYRDCDTWKIEQFLKEENSWVRYCGEWWHYEYENTGLSNRAAKGSQCPGTPQPANCNW